MQKLWKYVAVIVIIIVAVTLSRSNKQDTNNLKIGVIAPLAGDFAGVGENIVKGIKAAQATYEEKTGNKIELVVENDSADAAKGLSAYKKLTEIDHIDGLINTFTSTMDSIYDLTKQAGYPIMMEAFQANNVADDHVFQMTPGNAHTWDRYARYIMSSDFDQSKVVLVHSADAAQDSFAKAFMAEYKNPTTEVVASSDRNGLRTDAAKIAALKPTMVIVLMTPENGAVLTKELLPLIDPKTQLAYDLQLYTGSSFYQDQLGGDLSKINGAISIMLEGDLNSSAYKDFVTAYQKLYPNETPGFLADYGYDTFLVYLNAYDKENAQWTKNIKETDMKGASGDIKFDENGITFPSFVIKKVIDGKAQTLSRLPL